MTGLSPSQLNCYDVQVDPLTVIHYTEVKLDDQAKPKLLMIHGYGGNSSTYYKTFNRLASGFHLVSIDLPGMGFNSRPKNPFNSIDSCIDFFVITIKKFVDSIGWSKFSLLGHSMGAYFSTHFFDRFSEMIEKLYLISPAGFSPPSPQTKKDWTERADKMSFFARRAYNFGLKSILEEKKSPFELGFDWIRNTFFLNFLIKKYYEGTRFKFTEEERAHLGEISKYLFKLPQCGERCLGYTMTYGLNSERPIINVLKAHPHRLEDVMLSYGANDWMDYSLAYRYLRDEGLLVNVYRISECDHQIPFQNPEELSLCILDFHTKEGQFEVFDYFVN